MKHLWTLIVLLLGVFLLGVGGMQSGYDNATEAFTVTGEAANVDYDTEYNLSKSGEAESFNESIVVRANGTVLTEGSDYEWHQSRGNVSWINSSATSAGDAASIDYEYQDHPEGTEFSFNMFHLMLLFISFMMVYVALKWVLGGL